VLKQIQDLFNVFNLIATIVIAMITTVKDTVKNAKLVEVLATVFLKEVFLKGVLKKYLLVDHQVMQLIQNFLWLIVLTMEVDLVIISIISLGVLHVLVTTIFVPINAPNVSINVKVLVVWVLEESMVALEETIKGTIVTHVIVNFLNVINNVPSVQVDLVVETLG